MKPKLTLLAALLLAPLARGAQLTPVPIQQVVIEDAFWSPKIKTWREVTIPDCLAKFEKDGTLLNFDRVRDGQLKEKHNGPPWYDGLLYEMIRGCCRLSRRAARPGAGAAAGRLHRTHRRGPSQGPERLREHLHADARSRRIASA